MSWSIGNRHISYKCNHRIPIFLTAELGFISFDLGVIYDHKLIGLSCFASSENQATPLIFKNKKCYILTLAALPDFKQLNFNFETEGHKYYGPYFFIKRIFFKNLFTIFFYKSKIFL